MSEGSGAPATHALDADLDHAMAAHGDAIYSLCYRVLRDPVHAEDVLQHVFLEAHRDAAKYEGRATLRTWLFSIAIHRCQDAIKADRRRRQRIEVNDVAVTSYEDPADGPAAQLARRHQLAALDDCLELLSSDASLAVLARFKLELSYEQMASALKAKADTLQTRVTRALPILKRCLERKGWTGE